MEEPPVRRDHVADCGGDRGVREQQQFIVVGDKLRPRPQAQARAAPRRARLRPGHNAAVVALVPAAIKSKGTLTVAADASYAPNEFFAPDGHTVIGMDADLSKALAAADGAEGQRRQRDLRRRSSPVSPPASTTSACRRSPTPRRGRRWSTSSTYFDAGTSFYHQGVGRDQCDRPRRPVRQDGRRREGDDRGDRRHRPERQVQEGREAGRHGARPSRTRTAPTWRSSSGRAQLGMADSPVAAYRVKQSNGQFKLVGTTYGTAPYGIAVPKTGRPRRRRSWPALKVADARTGPTADPRQVGRSRRAPIPRLEGQ